MQAEATTQRQQSSGVELDEQITNVPNSPASAFASLSLDDDDVERTASTGTRNLAAEVESATQLVEALDAARKKPKPLIRSTGHRVKRTCHEHHLLSWKTSEFAYRKSSSVGSELPTLARGLFTERLLTRDGSIRHRIVVRGYDKFFNLGEMPWTKQEAIAAYTTAPYVLTFKENGCIIFIAALSDQEVVVTSKHSLGSLDGVTMAHAQKGDEWLDVHLQRAGKTRAQLADELWRRNETAVFELCDDSFEEHVLEYSREKSGLHLHGLNVNSASFRTRPMDEVDAFAREWGFIPTRYMVLRSLAELHELTDRIGMSGSWEGEPIEGFVIRTHMPTFATAPGSSSASLSNDAETSLSAAAAVAAAAALARGPVSPPYAPGQAWFYKFKFDEPYLMYRDWRELTRKMLSQKAAWEKTVHSRSGGGSGSPEAAESPSSSEKASVQGVSTAPAEAAMSETDIEAAAAAGTAAASSCTDDGGEAKVSKSQLKKDRKRLDRERQEAEAKQRAAAIQAGIAPPEPPQARSKRPETILFIQWCYDRLYGADGVKARPDLFATFSEGKGIIALRNTFLDYLKTDEGQQKLHALGGGGGGATAATDAPNEHGNTTAAEDARPFTKTVITPIAVPGCGKTVLAVALTDLFGFGHVQSDDFKGKKGFLAGVEKEMASHSVLFADKNNHLFQQRDELVELIQRLSDPNQVVRPKKKKGGKKGETDAPTAIPRIRTVALAWKLDALPLNALHRICSDRIVARGDNHQTLRADVTGAAGTRDHETILWRFLEQLQPYGSALSGEGAEGSGDAHFDQTIWLSADEGLEQSLRRIVEHLCPTLGLAMPSDELIKAALEKALQYKPAVKRETKTDKKAKDEGATSARDADEQEKALGGNSNGGGGGKVRYYGIAVELDLCSVLDAIFSVGASPSDDAVLLHGRQFYHKLRTDKRITLRPHITLVHSAVVAREQELLLSPDQSQGTGTEDVVAASARWEVYSSLCRSSAAETSQGELEFDMLLDRLIWDGRVMTLSVRDVSSDAMPDFAQVQGGRGGQGQGTWRPHVTVGTAEQEIRPVEANRALMEAEQGREGVYQIRVGRDGQGIRAKGRLQGMNH